MNFDTYLFVHEYKKIRTQPTTLPIIWIDARSIDLDIPKHWIDENNTATICISNLCAKGLKIIGDSLCFRGRVSSISIEANGQIHENDEIYCFRIPTKAIVSVYKIDGLEYYQACDLIKTQTVLPVVDLEDEILLF